MPIGRPKGPPVPVSSDYYLSVLAATAVLPALSDVLDPKGRDGRLAALGVPLHADATKEDLDKPLRRGVYALSSPDQKTVLKLRVFSKEEANFDPRTLLESPLALTLDDETRKRIQATWTILQLTFESYDPALYPALDFFLRTASRLAELCQGVIADPLSQVYRLPSSVPTPTQEGLGFAVQDFVNTVLVATPSGTTVSTAGLSKFDQPELIVTRVPEPLVGAARSLLLSVAAGVMKGRTLAPGDKLVSEQGWVVSPSGETTVVRYELLPVSQKSVAEALAEWSGAHGS